MVNLFYEQNKTNFNFNSYKDDFNKCMIVEIEMDYYLKKSFEKKIKELPFYFSIPQNPEKIISKQ